MFSSAVLGMLCMLPCVVACDAPLELSAHCMRASISVDAVHHMLCKTRMHFAVSLPDFPNQARLLERAPHPL